LKHAFFQSSPQQGKARCEIGWNWSPAALSDYDLWYAVSGKGEMRIADQAYPIRKGTCFLIRPGDRPQAKQLPEDRLTVIYIHFRLIDMASNQEFNPHPLPPRYVQITETYEFELLLNKILEVNDRSELWKEDEFDCLMKQLFLHMYRIQFKRCDPVFLSQKQSQTITRVTAYIREQGGRRIALEELASLVHLSPAYLSVLFKKFNGTTLKEYMTKVRLERAMYLLKETSMNVSQVSEALGYSNVYLFSKQFKEHYGLPPSRFHFQAVPPKSHG
jgi:YesN/AraC family two-component response regulator